MEMFNLMTKLLRFYCITESCMNIHQPIVSMIILERNDFLYYHMKSFHEFFWAIRVYKKKTLNMVIVFSMIDRRSHYPLVAVTSTKDASNITNTSCIFQLPTIICTLYLGRIEV